MQKLKATDATIARPNPDEQESAAPSPAPRLTRYRKPILLMAALAALLAAAFYRWETTAGSDCTLAAPKDQFLIVSVQESGILKELKVKDGDWVDQGDILGVCEDLEMEKQVVLLKAHIEQLQTNLSIIESRRKEQQAVAEQTSSQYDRRRREADELSAEEAAIQAFKDGQEISADYPPELLELGAQTRARQSDEQAQKIDKDRYEYLFQQGLAAQALVDAARSRLQVAEQERKAAENRLMAAKVSHSRKTKSAITEEAAAKDALQAATQKLATLDAEFQLINDQRLSKKNELALMEKKRDSLILRAPRAGIALGRDIEKRLGQYLERGSELCRVAELSELQAIAEVSEWDIARVRVGSSARFRIRSLNDRVFYGTVSHVNTEVVVKPETGDRVYNCEIIIDNKEKILRPGMSGFARISLGQDPIYLWTLRWIKRFVRFEYWVW